MADSLVDHGCIELSDAAGAVTGAGLAFLDDFGIDIHAVPGSGRGVFCRPCLDWSERRPHVGGPLGRALASRCFALGWIERTSAGRAVAVMEAGRRGFAERFGSVP
jgi:hypothetical protein